MLTLRITETQETIPVCKQENVASLSETYMTPEEQKHSDQNKLPLPNFASVCESLEKLTESTPVERRFPIGELKNRLINLGLREFLEIGHYKDFEGHIIRGRALDVYGFPFKFVSQLDEAILATTQFLRRFSSEEGSTLSLRTTPTIQGRRKEFGVLADSKGQTLYRASKHHSSIEQGWR